MIITSVILGDMKRNAAFNKSQDLFSHHTFVWHIITNSQIFRYMYANACIGGERFACETNMAQHLQGLGGWVK